MAHDGGSGRYANSPLERRQRDSAGKAVRRPSRHRLGENQARTRQLTTMQSPPGREQPLSRAALSDTPNTLREWCRTAHLPEQPSN